MLNLDPTKRCNAIKLLNHSWFDGITKEHKCDHDPKITKLMNRNKMSKLLIGQKYNDNSNTYFPFETPSNKQRMQPQALDFENNHNVSEQSGNSISSNDYDVKSSYTCKIIKIQSSPTF